MCVQGWRARTVFRKKHADENEAVIRWNVVALSERCRSAFQRAPAREAGVRQTGARAIRVSDDVSTVSFCQWPIWVRSRELRRTRARVAFQ